MMENVFPPFQKKFCEIRYPVVTTSPPGVIGGDEHQIPRPKDALTHIIFKSICKGEGLMKSLKLSLLLLAAAGFLGRSQVAQAQDIDNPKEVSWRVVWNYTQEEFEKKTDEYKAENFRIHDLEVYNQRGNTVFACIYHDNYDDRGWWAVWRYDSEQFDTSFAEYRAQYRMTDIEVFTEMTTGTEDLRYSGVWVENKENLRWACRWNLSSDQWNTEFAKYKNDGYRPIDIEVYIYGGEVYFAAVWVENQARRTWEMVWGQSHEQYQAKFNQMVDKTFRPVDMESYVIDGTMYYAGIWESDERGDAWSARWNLSATEYDEKSDEFINKNKRPLDFYSYSIGDTTYYGGIWTSNGEEPATPAPNNTKPGAIPSGGGSGD